ncbi:PIG-L deacetylase family protein [Kineococcus sp. SYSU DK003]|uniref:PIG-L deacetylase family protein n=1 Tax=Kineococcus sp. SYSU DK003 TaxID=3383124 RepID=UPI003D7E8543
MNTTPRSVLAVGAHPDDIEMGCGGTLARHAASGDRVTMLVITYGQAGPGDVRARMREQQDASATLGADLVWGHLPDGKVSNHELDLVHLIESTIREVRADVVYTHGVEDTHQDHRAVALATLGAARHCRQVLTYESPSSYGFRPHVFVDVSSALDKKADALRCHRSQVADSRMVDLDVLHHQAGYRGFQSRVGTAEAFVPHRLVLEV